MTEQHWRKRQTKMIDVASIKIGDRIIHPSEARIAAMAKSLSSDLGQLNPILITKYLTAWRVVAGATRLMAADKLGWDQIEATIIGADNEYEYQLIEIAENFDRYDLSDAERKRLKDADRELRAARLVHFEKLAAGEDTPPIKKAKGGRGKKGGVRDAARQAGVPRTTAQRKLAQNEKRASLDEATPATKPKPTTGSDQPSCSFCGKGPDHVSTLIVSTLIVSRYSHVAIAICNECVDLCVDLIAEQKKSASHIADEIEDAAEASPGSPRPAPHAAKPPQPDDDDGIPAFLRRQPS